MLILLPPSEGKSEPPSDGKPAELDRLVFADVLTEAREGLLDELVGLPKLDRDEAVVEDPGVDLGCRGRRGLPKGGIAVDVGGLARRDPQDRD
ncbi:MAG: hypothetical protein ACKORM_01500, partial [Solirubrobacterales bacterium]